MIGPGSKVILKTEDAIYSPCEVVAISAKAVTVKFAAGMKRDRKTKQMYMDIKVETVSRDKIVSMSERF